MKVITAPNDYILKPGEISVFLAGGITNCPNWQANIIEQLDNYHLPQLVVFNPRRENFPINDPNASYEQIEWEFKYLERADIFSMYFCASESDQPICMYELGRYISRMQSKHPTTWKYRIVISVEDGYKRKNDVLIQTNLACGDLFVNTQMPILQDYHTIMIKQSFHNILELRNFRY
ncbi:MAG: nucleoside 2-deoxyribosyltransferase domain-containing protein [Bacilli bacterium]|nr:nucleoside 2-deoxyribosyltransferase domain-containing protein [Bacilli bacterium]